MKKFTKRKGFTIVELVIVIAVIGILAGILIPTFVSLTKKANKASDQSLVTNLNKSLALAEQDTSSYDGYVPNKKNVYGHAYGRSHYRLTKIYKDGGYIANEIRNGVYEYSYLLTLSDLR